MILRSHALWSLTRRVIQNGRTRVDFSPNLRMSTRSLLNVCLVLVVAVAAVVSANSLAQGASSFSPLGASSSSSLPASGGPPYLLWHFGAQATGPVYFYDKGSKLVNFRGTTETYSVANSTPLWRSAIFQGQLLHRGERVIALSSLSAPHQRVASLSVHTGTVQWTFTLPANLSDVRFSHSDRLDVVVVVGVVNSNPSQPYQGRVTYRFWGIAASTGTQLWEHQIPGSHGIPGVVVVSPDDGGGSGGEQQEGDNNGAGSSSGMVTAVYETLLSNNSLATSVVTFHVGTGAIAWQCTTGCCGTARLGATPLIAPVGETGGRYRLFLAVDVSPRDDPTPDSLCALNVATGKTLWVNASSRYISVFPKAARNNTVFAYSYHENNPSTFIAYDMATGNVKWTYSTSGWQHMVLGVDGAGRSNGEVYLSGWAGTILRFDEETGLNTNNWTLPATSASWDDDQVRYFAVDAPSSTLIGVTGCVEAESGHVFAALLSGKTPPPHPPVPQSASEKWCYSVGGDQGGQSYAPLFVSTSLPPGSHNRTVAAIIVPGYSAVYSLGQSNGDPLWQFQSLNTSNYAGNALTTAVFGDASMSTVAFVWQQGYVSTLVVLNATSGSLVHSIPTPQGFNSGNPTIVASPLGSPTGLVFVTYDNPSAHVSSETVAYSTVQGIVLWSLVNVSAVYAEGNAVLLWYPGGTLALINGDASPEGRVPLWTCTLPVCLNASYISIYAGVMYLTQPGSTTSFPPIPATVSAVTMGSPMSPCCTVLWSVTDNVQGGVVAISDDYYAYWLTGNAAELAVASRLTGLRMRVESVPYGWDGAVNPYLTNGLLLYGSDKLWALDVAANEQAFTVSHGSFSSLSQAPFATTSMDAMLLFWKTSVCYYALT